jgi:hypothetical protein
VTITKLESRIDHLFGRETDLTQLLQRTQGSGLTVILGPPQIGKSWLLMELAYRLDCKGSARCLIGFTRSPNGANDPLLQVVCDLYQRWLADADAWEQLKTVWQQQKDGLLPALARFVGKLSEKAAKLVPIFGDLGGTAIRESLEGLVAADEDLSKGRLIVSRLEYSQAQELVSSVQRISGHPVSLMMDQWEETRDLEQQLNTFRDFLREPEQWPNCHFLLGARAGSKAADLLKDLEAEYPSGVQVHKLGEMDLADTAERWRLIGYLRVQPELRALENISDDRVIELIAGYPRVINRWTAEDARDSARTFDGLEQLAKDANAFRYRDLEKLLLDLDGDRRKLAVRVALVPLAEDANAWGTLEPVILGDVAPDTLDELKNSNIFDREAEPPKFGHPTRRDAARAFLDAHWPEVVKVEAEGLIVALARSVAADGETTRHCCEALVSLHDVAEQRHLGRLSLGLCEAALGLLDKRVRSPNALIEGAREAWRLREPGVGFLLASALSNGVFFAKFDGDLARRDAFLDEYLILGPAYCDDASVRGELARGLANEIASAEEENNPARSQALL